jgi:hypothetical protein
MDDHGLLYASTQDFLSPTMRHQSATRRRVTIDSRSFGHHIFSDPYLFSFYCHFHASHPFVLPQPVLKSLAKNLSVQPLLAAMRWIGSLYRASQSTKCSLYDKAKSDLLKFNRPSDGFLIQATMLLAIGLSGTGKHQKAIELLQRAKSMAIDTGLHKESQFAIVVDNASMVESWRRTWWELYVLDGLFACAYQTAKFTLCELDADVKLPCEEMEYFTRVRLIGNKEASHSDSDRIFRRDLQTAQSSSHHHSHVAFSVCKSWVKSRTQCLRSSQATCPLLQVNCVQNGGTVYRRTSKIAYRAMASLMR